MDVGVRRLEAEAMQLQILEVVGRHVPGFSVHSSLVPEEVYRRLLDNKSRFLPREKLHRCDPKSCELLHFKHKEPFKHLASGTDRKATGTVFVCKLTGAVHVCTPDLCDRKVENESR